ncbi:MAG TPA: triose-phosphate isomerase [Candidatus Saccharimonadales bacterium]|nr:triose-phosphate isomerase [Candidatus Saccharimonadales bacterium]
MKKTLLVGNWKMHLTVHESSVLVHRLHQHIKAHRTVEVVLAPSMLALQPVSMEIDRRVFRLAAQNAYPTDEGAFTGEVSFAMLQNLVHYAIVGHSARRLYFGETLEMVRDKVQAAFRNGITPILCIGETQQERLEGETKRVIYDQLTTALANLTSDEVETMVIAYEPVWAISSGSDFANHEVAKPDEVQRIVDYIRHNVSELYGETAANAVRVLYGGSSNAENARAYLELPGIDGLLPGGASLNYKEFSAMVDTAALVHTEKEHTHAKH